MKKIHFVVLFVVCIFLVLLVDAQDITSVVDLFTLHPIDYLFLLIWASVFFLMLLPFVFLSERFLFATKKIERRGKKNQ